MHRVKLGLILIAVILNLPCVRGEGCPQSIPTRTEVPVCPKDITEWEKARERKQCHVISENCTTDNKFEYHCLSNSNLGQFVEVCAPTKVIVGQYCPSYDMERNIIEPNFQQSCKAHLKPCLNVYKSSFVYQYQECFLYKENNKDSNNIINPITIVNDNTVVDNGVYVICASLAVLIILLFISICCPGSCKGMCKRFLKCNLKKTDTSPRAIEEQELNGEDRDNSNDNRIN